MRNLAYALCISALGVVLFAALKLLGESSISSWGIFICAAVFMVSLVLFLFNHVRSGEGAK